VACAWWTDHLGRRHVRVAGRRRHPNARLHPFLDRVGHGPSLLTCPDRVFRRTVGQRVEALAACGCGQVGAPEALGWTGDCCGPCHDRRQDGRPTPQTPAALAAVWGVEAVAVDAAGHTVAALTSTLECRVWGARDGALRLAAGPRFTQGFSRALALSPDGKRAAVALGNDRIGLLQVKGGRRFAEQWADGLTALAFAPDGRRVAYLSSVGLGIWDGRTVESLGSGWFPWRGALAFSPDGRRVAAGHFGQVELRGGEADATLDIGRGHVWSLAFSPDGRRLAVGRGGDWYTHRTDGRILIARRAVAYLDGAPAWARRRGVQAARGGVRRLAARRSARLGG
jgi:hypothetical protein